MSLTRTFRVKKYLSLILIFPYIFDKSCKDIFCGNKQQIKYGEIFVKKGGLTF
jgi:hypothetical protein